MKKIILMNDFDAYIENIKNRTLLKYLIGLIPRILNYYKAEFICGIARLKGAEIGKNTYIPLKLAIRANNNLIIGDSTIIETVYIDLRNKVEIGSNVIINKGVEIIRASHFVDSVKFETFSKPLIIEDYSWITTKTLVMPNCTLISFGVVTASGTVVTSSVLEKKTIVGGNPMKIIRKRKNVHDKLIVESLQGRDLIYYLKVRKNHENR